MNCAEVLGWVHDTAMRRLSERLGFLSQISADVYIGNLRAKDHGGNLSSKNGSCRNAFISTRVRRDKVLSGRSQMQTVHHQHRYIMNRKHQELTINCKNHFRKIQV